ncbi:alcohol oxidase [Exidia glandulosa HHB12029]|uniref:Alcohol oxidase n=1 Tax=Exidia glandulosa HHB12029 TaxID=1314781 RepID=A0A165FDC9_EXIGL|nr:alcohol oxidase [Exidia glandulosa HHB12029]
MFKLVTKGRQLRQPEGLTVGSRLSEDPRISVLVLEAGQDAEDFQEVIVPGLILTGQSVGGILDWKYQTVPQPNFNGRQITLSAGKALGGSSVTSALIFTRGQKEQYDAWGSLNNDPSWGFSALLPFFKKSEHVFQPDAYQRELGAKLDLPFRGAKGAAAVGYGNFEYAQSALWRSAAEKLGLPAGTDETDGETRAVSVSTASIDPRNNTRCDATCAYYTPVSRRPNFTVMTNVTVTRILWKSTKVPGDAVAGGVEYVDQSGVVHNISVTREVIVAAGAIGSPKILELSGVGNPAILKSAGVKPVVTLPAVGENLSDDMQVWVNSVAVNVEITADVLAANPTFAAEQLDLWSHNRTGLLSRAPCSLTLTAPSDLFSHEALAPLLKAARANISHYASQFSNGISAVARGIVAQHTAALSLWERNAERPVELFFQPGYLGPTPAAQRPGGANTNFSSITTLFYTPLSRGRVHIASSDPSVPPTLDPAYWSHPLDSAAHVKGVQFARKMLKTAPLSSINGGEFEPGEDKQSDEDVEAWMRTIIQSDFHAVGTAVMLPKELGGVVDTKLKVYGTRNVRVVDASIFPLPLSAHTLASVYAVAEKAADMIKKSG